MSACPQGIELLQYSVRQQLAANVTLVLSDLQAGVILNSTATKLIAEAQQGADGALALVAAQAAQCQGAPAGSTLCAAFAAQQRAAAAAALADVRASLAALDATGYRAGAARMIDGVSALAVRLQPPRLAAATAAAATPPHTLHTSSYARRPPWPPPAPRPCAQVNTPELADRISAATGQDPSDAANAALSAVYGGLVSKERLQSVALPLLQGARARAMKMLLRV